ncbi:MAG: ribokinase [bacterium]
MKPKIVVVGSANTDMILKTSHLPKSGETVLGGKFSMAAGGKGANQAVAAARAGGDVTFISRLGCDLFGEQALAGYIRDGINTQFIQQEPETSSGIAFIVVDANGNNNIAVASGANAHLSPDDINLARSAIAAADILLVQLEIPIETVRHAILLASQAGVTTILNPAPAQLLEHELLGLVSILTPNEFETEMLTKISVKEDPSAPARVLLKSGVAKVIITLGERGAFFADGTHSELILAYPVKAVDTTAAGDVFNGVLAVAVGEKQEIRSAIRFANAAAALSVTKLGAQPSAPSRNEIESLIAAGK